MPPAPAGSVICSAPVRIRGLNLRVHEGPALDEATIDACVALRGQSMGLKPHITPADDRAQLAAWLRASGATVAIARDDAGTVHSFIDMNARRFDHAGHNYLVCFGNYVFASPQYRSHPAYALGNLWSLLVHCRRHRTVSPIVYTGALYPPSFIVGARTFPRFWAASEPDAPPQLVSLLDRAAPEIFGSGWDPTTRLLTMRTLPSPHVPRSEAGRAAMARYEACNPRWREGFGVLMLAPLVPANVAGLLRRLLAMAV